MEQVISPKIALVHDFIYTFAGAERVLQALHYLYPEAPIYTTFFDHEIVVNHFKQATIYASTLQRSQLKKHPSLLLARYPRAVEEWDFSKYDIVISSSGAFSHGIITGPNTRHICYCHSPMRYVWDWHIENLIERRLNRGIKGFAASRIMSSLRLWDQVSAKRVDTWIANSNTVKERIAKYYRQEATIIHPPIDTSFFAEETHTERAEFALTISRLSSNKHIDHIIQACHAVNLPLVVVGRGTEQTNLEQLALRLRANVRFVPSCSEEEKRTFLQQARCFIFAAEDDFGIAPVEALAAGTPVIGLGKGGLKETVQNGKNGILYSEQTTDALRDALSQFLEKGVSLTEKKIKESAHPFDQAVFRQKIQSFVAHA